MDINLLEGYDKPTSQRSVTGKRTTALILLCIAIVMLGGAMEGLVEKRIHQLTVTEKSLTQQLAHQTKSQPSSAESAVATNRRNIAQVQAILDKRRPIDEMLNDIQADLVRGMTVDTIHTLSGGLQIVGHAQNVGDVATFEKRLAGHPWSSGANVQNIQYSSKLALLQPSTKQETSNLISQLGKLASGKASTSKKHSSASQALVRWSSVFKQVPKNMPESTLVYQYTLTVLFGNQAGGKSK